MKDGLERAPVYPEEPEQPWTSRQEESVMAFQLVEEHHQHIRSLLRLDTDMPYRASETDLEARRRDVQFNRSIGHFTARSVYELGSRVLATVAQMEGEFRRQTVLDIGCGEGRFGEAIARNAKAKVTFLDNDPEVLKRVSPRAGEIVAADGRELPFEDESFDKVMCAFSSLHWAATPVESAQAINEALRVAKTGGSALLIPLLSNLHLRQAHVDAVEENLRQAPDFMAEQEWRALKVWALQDHILINTLLKLAEDGYCAVTWSDQIWRVGGTSVDVEHCSAIVDKLKPIPPEFFADNLAYAKQFMETAKL